MINKYIKPALLSTALLTIAFFTTGMEVTSSVNLDGDKEKVSEQIWAVQIEADPGESGSLEQNFEAAHGPEDPDYEAGETGEVKKDAYADYEDETGNLEIAKGEEYVGSYFEIEQEAGTTGGTTKRYIDISSPVTGAYLYEDMEVEGSADITESFEMINLEPGTEEVPDWEDLF